MIFTAICVTFFTNFAIKIGTTKTDMSMATVTTVKAVAGYPTKLPCDVSPPSKQEHVYLILWYKHEEGEPIYSYDARSASLIGMESGRRWSDVGSFGDRAYFNLNESPAYLKVDNIRPEEAGFYRCRIDFKTAPTRNSFVNVTVIIPPSIPSIFDEYGTEFNSVAGPYNIGDDIILKCISFGGWPSPAVTWWRNGHLVDSTFENNLDGKSVENRIHLYRVTKSDLNTNLVCQAINNNISLPASTKVTIDLVFGPDSVRILNRKEPLSAEMSYQFECQSFGSRPAAIITWKKNYQILPSAESLVLDDGNITLSRLTFKPSISDNGNIISCRAENAELESETAFLEDTWKLTIYFSPRIQLYLGSKLNPSEISESNDVYFECNIRANPKAYKVVWTHNNKVLRPNASLGIFQSDHNLVMQSVSRNQGGNYSCSASNTEGDAQSNTLELRIQFKPRCKWDRESVLGVDKETLTTTLNPIECQIEADPPATKFKWTFNSSLDTATEIQLNTHSQVFDFIGFKEISQHLTMLSSEVYGILGCWAENSIGAMDSPCTFTLIPAGSPEMPINCTVRNQTTESLLVGCLQGFDGGLKQKFHLELFDLSTGQLVINKSANFPLFQVSGLNPGRAMNIIIYASNSNGKSSHILIEGFTLKVAELQLESPMPLEFVPLLGILVGVLVTLSFIGISVLFILRNKFRSRSRGKLNQHNTFKENVDSEGSYRINGNQHGIVNIESHHQNCLKDELKAEKTKMLSASQRYNPNLNDDEQNEFDKFVSVQRRNNWNETLRENENSSSHLHNGTKFNKTDNWKSASEIINAKINLSAHQHFPASQNLVIQTHKTSPIRQMDTKNCMQLDQTSYDSSNGDIECNSLAAAFTQKDPKYVQMVNYSNEQDSKTVLSYVRSDHDTLQWIPLFLRGGRNQESTL